MEAFFADYKTIIIFLHVISAVVWVGGMVAMRYAAHPSFKEIESPFKRLERVADALKRLFSIVLPFVIILLVTAVLMINGYETFEGEFVILIYIKLLIWIVMSINLSAMILRRNKAQKALKRVDSLQAKIQLEMIGKFMVPLNIVLGVIAIFLGTFLSNSF